MSDRPKVLVVDDHQMTRNLVKSILRESGFNEVVQAESGEAALEEIEVNPDIGLVICDWNMPGVTGLEVLREVRIKEETKNVAFLMLTAEVYRSNVTAAIEAGVDDYIAKPFTTDVLLDKVNAVLRRKGG